MNKYIFRRVSPCGLPKISKGQALTLQLIDYRYPAPVLSRKANSALPYLSWIDDIFFQKSLKKFLTNPKLKAINKLEFWERR